MQSSHSKRLRGCLRIAACVLILKVTIGVVLIYRDYFPPDFSSDFLHGREGYFRSSYQWAFYPHIAAGPCSLVLGMILLSERFRVRFTRWHRILGRIHVTNVLLLVAPSGLWMAFYALTGPIAGAGFASVAIGSALTAGLGWRAAVQRRFADHRQWMWRCYLMLCSAVTLRLAGGAFTIANVEAEWTYPFVAWASWLVPLAAYEVFRLQRQRITR